MPPATVTIEQRDDEIARGVQAEDVDALVERARDVGIITATYDLIAGSAEVSCSDHGI